MTTSACPGCTRSHRQHPVSRPKHRPFSHRVPLPVAAVVRRGGGFCHGMVSRISTLARRVGDIDGIKRPLVGASVSSIRRAQVADTRQPAVGPARARADFAIVGDLPADDERSHGTRAIAQQRSLSSVTSTFCTRWSRKGATEVARADIERLPGETHWQKFPGGLEAGPRSATRRQTGLRPVCGMPPG